MLKKSLILLLILSLLLTLTGCPLIDKLKGNTKTSYNKTDVAGEYFYEIWDGEPQFNINYHVVNLNSDGTCSVKFEWVSISGTQTTTQPEAFGTWDVVDKKVKIEYDSGGLEEYDIENNKLLKKFETGFQTGEYSVLNLKKG